MKVVGSHGLQYFTNLDFPVHRVPFPFQKKQTTEIGGQKGSQVFPPRYPPRPIQLSKKNLKFQDPSYSQQSWRLENHPGGFNVEAMDYKKLHWNDVFFTFFTVHQPFNVKYLQKIRPSTHQKRLATNKNQNNLFLTPKKNNRFWLGVLPIWATHTLQNWAFKITLRATALAALEIHRAETGTPKGMRFKRLPPEGY